NAIWGDGPSLVSGIASLERRTGERGCGCRAACRLRKCTRTRIRTSHGKRSRRSRPGRRERRSRPPLSSDPMKVVLPDGAELELPDGASGLDAARAIGPKLAEQAVLVRVDGEPRDLRLTLADA